MQLISALLLTPTSSSTGFECRFPTFELGPVESMVRGYIAQGLFPPIIGGAGAMGEETKAEAK